MNCKSCGAVFKAGAKFCSQCGAVNTATAGAVEAGSVAQTIRCPQCGVENPASARFCRGDGYRLQAAKEALGGQTTQATLTSAIPASKPAAPPPAVGTAPRRPEAPRPSRPPPAVSGPTAAAPGPAGSSRPLILGGGVLVLLLAAGGAGYAYWTGRVGDRPGSIASEVTDQLKNGGFDDVTVTMAKDWVAMITGTVVGQHQRQQLEAIVSARSEIRRVDLSELKVQPSLDEIQVAVVEALGMNGLGDIDAKVAEGGLVVLTGRASDSSTIGRAGETIADVPGVAAVDNRIAIPFIELQGEINNALRAGGHPRVRVTVSPHGEISAIGTLRAEEDRSVIIERVVATAVGFGEALDPSTIRDEMIVERPVIVASPAPRAQTAAPTPADNTAPVESVETGDPVAAASPLPGMWVGSIKWGIVGSNAALAIDNATVGQPAGRSAYGGSYNYCTGTLRLVDAAGSEYTFDETIVEKDPRATCPGGGMLRMVLSGPSTADVKWTRANKLSAVRYKGTLHKR